MKASILAVGRHLLVVCALASLHIQKPCPVHAQHNNGDTSTTRPMRQSPGVSVLEKTPARAAAPLPRWVYAQWADPAVRVIDMPAGDYYLPGSAPLVMRRSNVVVNFKGCKLLVNPADRTNDSFYPVRVASSAKTSPVFGPSPTGSSKAVRTLSHLSGRISASTTQLTMDPGERVSILPGETVMIWAGVAASDPVEPEHFIVATIASVDHKTGVVTFTEPLKKDVVDYGSLETLATATEKSLRWKIGAWGTYPSDANFSKGFGRDHGLERFAGGVVHDVTFNDLSVELDEVVATDAPHGMWEVSAIGVQRFTMRNASVRNPHGSALHLWRAFDIVIDGFTVTGVGTGQVGNAHSIEAYAATIWGGENLDYHNVSVSGLDIGGFNAEVGPRSVRVEHFNYDVTFSAARTYPSPPHVFGFFGVTDVVRVKDATIRAVTDGGSSHVYFSYAPFASEGYLSFPGTYLSAWFDFGYQHRIALTGTVTIGGVVYGPAITRIMKVHVRRGDANRHVEVPPGIYTNLMIEMLQQRDVRDISDSFGVTYFDAIKAGKSTSAAPDKWFQIGPGAASLRDYLRKALTCWFNDNGAIANADIQLTMTYLPAATSAP